MFHHLLDYLYFGVEGTTPEVLDRAWRSCLDPLYWDSLEHVIVAEMACQNGLAVALWVGAEYLVDMVTEFLSVES